MHQTALLVVITIAQLFILSKTTEAQSISAMEIVELSKERHDPEKSWSSAVFKIHIQEPRLANPLRYSELYLNNASGEFSLSRTIEVGLIERLITSNGESKILLNGSDDISAKIKEEYSLQSERNAGYRAFYQTMYGLPMSINKGLIKKAERVGEIVYEGTDVFEIRLELFEPLISDKWVLYISKEDYSIVALKLDHSPNSERPDEVIKFDGEYEFDGITIPRFRNWYHVESREYRGSDIIVKEIKN